MAEAGLLIDNDVFLLLSGAGALDRALTALGFSRDQVLRLDSLPYMIQKSKSIQKKYRPVLLARAAAECTLVPAIKDWPSAHIESLLSGRVGIDPGEVVLYGLLAERPYHLLASNDKRAMDVVANDPALASIRQAVAGRIICLERIVRALLDREGLEATARLLAPIRDCDTLLRVLLSPTNLVSTEAFVAALDSYWGDLRRNLAEGFLYE